MKPHTKIYMEYFGYTIGDYVPCEITGRPTQDISHNDPRGMGGSKEKDGIENLMALTRPLHAYLEANPKLYDWFKARHLEFMECQRPYAFMLGSRFDLVFKEIIKQLTKQ